ncbi:hypothetical protein OKA05_11055 [Luteolibacter arcticus]|uniref:Uncharacterized protein n=1 Tax=Luteolibacter arcticus TaxID=1581411 RepID=A0ABT3GHW7_9BACT|nr:hypothetical protein [Luteolibacter arcticus]MCW1923092.1 hypothetical protein [Luteolibacter arcticus]
MRDGRGGFLLREGAEVLNDWGDGCLIRSDELVSTEPADTCFVAEGDALVALRFPQLPVGVGPFEYLAEKDYSDIRITSIF